MLLFSIILVSSTLVSLAVGEDNEGIFTSNADLQNLLLTEGQLVRGMKEYIEAEESKMEKIKKYIQDYESIQTKSSVDTEEYVGNPLNSYLLIKKMTSDWKELQDLITQSPSAVFLQNLTSQRDVLKWPSDEDLSGAAAALMRLQDNYKLATVDLANGQLNGVNYGPSLTAHDCFELGRQSYNAGDHYHSTLWMNQALRRWEEEEVKTVERADILEYLAFSAYVQGNMRRALKLTVDLIQLRPDHPRAAGNKVYYENALKDEGGKVQKRGEDGLGDMEDPVDVTVAEEPPEENKTEERLLYEQLCRGENQMTEKYRAQLFCRYTFGASPYLKLCPHKEEDVFLKPRILIYHDVLSDKEIAVIKSMATPKFKRATVQNYKTGELETASYRISKTAWLKREDNVYIEGIYQRVADVTGLNMETSEELQVSNYGIGGHYEPHFDFARREEKNAFQSLGTGNRIATWLFYESEVEQGGATVFPQLGIGLWPKKGAAVFWYNLHRNGEGDDMTRHAACPVLAGSKWVSNFWIHERGQEFTRPCTQSPFE